MADGGPGMAPFFPDGSWGFEENWPRRAEGPVFDLMHGDRHMARVWKEGGRWQLVLRPQSQVTTDLESLLQVLAMIADRMRAFEEQRLSASGGAPDARNQVADAGAAIGRLLGALSAGSNSADAVRWGALDEAAPADR